MLVTVLIGAAETGVELSTGEYSRLSGLRAIVLFRIFAAVARLRVHYMRKALLAMRAAISPLIYCTGEFGLLCCLWGKKGGGCVRPYVVLNFVFWCCSTSWLLE